MAKDSDAVAFVRHLYAKSLSATGHSWTRLNGAMYQSVHIAIAAGLEFDLDDIGVMLNEMRGSYWFHDDGPESWYRKAIEIGNRSAWKALERYFKREPFIFNGNRLFVGSRIEWDGKMADVTSFSSDGNHLVACVGERRDNSRKTVKRHKITRDDLRERSVKKPKKAKSDDSQEEAACAAAQ